MSEANIRGKYKIDKSTGSSTLGTVREKEGDVQKTGIWDIRAEGATATIVGKSLARVNQAVESDQAKGDRRVGTGGRRGRGAGEGGDIVFQFTTIIQTASILVHQTQG